MKMLIIGLLTIASVSAFADENGFCKVTLKVRDNSSISDLVKYNMEYAVARQDTVAGFTSNAEECLCAAEASAVGRYVGGWVIKKINVEFTRGDFKTSSFYKNADSLKVSLNSLRKVGFCITNPEMFKIER